MAESKPRAMTSEGFPAPFQDGEGLSRVPCRCPVCYSEQATLALIRKGKAKGGYHVMCPICICAIFLNGPVSVRAFRAYQRLLTDDGTREALKIALAEHAPRD